MTSPSTRSRFLFVAFAILLLASFAGCQPAAQNPAQVPPSANGVGGTVADSSTDKPEATDEEHGHVDGVHGGTIVPLGRDSYHIEPVFEANGVVSLYTLGADETRVMEVDARETAGFVRLKAGGDPVEVKFLPAPQTGDTEGKASRLSATLPEAHRAGPVEITIPGIVIEGDRFRFSFATPEEEHVAEAMPAKVANAEEQKLYLEPGGIYTTADIEANGRVTASQKFDGFMAKHDMNPKTGDKICPVTETKANPECSWVVDGKVYEFCCPPCVDEFVGWAKTQPDKIQPPDSYVQK